MVIDIYFGLNAEHYTIVFWTSEGVYLMIPAAED